MQRRSAGAHPEVPLTAHSSAKKCFVGCSTWRIESSLSHPQMVLDMTGSYIVPTLILRSSKDRMQLGLACFRTGKDFLIASCAARTILGLQG